MDIIELYQEHKDFKKAIELSGIDPFKAHLKLIKSGILSIQDKIDYGTKGQILGAKAEEYFQKIIPEAVDANKYWRKNNPVFDFYYKGLTIDIKFSSLNKRADTHQEFWSIRSSGKQDFIVAFLEKEENKELDGAYILLLPKSFIRTKKTLQLTKKHNLFQQFLVEEKDLKKILDEYAEINHE